MKMFKVAQASFAALLCALSIFAPLHADEGSSPTPIEDARAILIAGNFPQTIDTMFTQLVPVMEAGFIGQLTQIQNGDKLVQRIASNYPGGTKAFGKRFGELMMVGIRAKFPDMFEKAAQQYVAEIEPDKLLAIRLFMESPSGISMTAAQPKIQKQMSSVGQVIGRKVGEQAAMQLMTEADRYLGVSK